MLTGVQIRMARVALGWSIRDLAERADVHHNTVGRIENGHLPSRGTNLLLKLALEKAGIEFKEDGSVRLCERRY